MTLIDLEQSLYNLCQVHLNLTGVMTSAQSCEIEGTLSPVSITTENGLKYYTLDDFPLRIKVAEYPHRPPICFETSHRNTDFHINPSDKSLCLETRYSLWKFFNENQDLLRFVNQIIVPYIIQYKHFKATQKILWGDRRHGGEGILDQFDEKFATTGQRTLALFTYGCHLIYRGHHVCPCGSGLCLRKCHGSYLRELFASYPSEFHMEDIFNCYQSFQKDFNGELWLKEFLQSKNDSPKSQLRAIQKAHSQLMKRLKLGYW